MIADILSGFSQASGLTRDSDVAYAIFFSLVAYLVLKVAYRIWFHPLSKFPGPKIAGATRAYEFYYNIVKDGMFLWKLEELHKKYGPIVRIAPNELHISDPAFYNEIYSGQSNPRDKYPPFYRFTGATHSAFETHDHRLHNLRRQPLMNAFSKRAIVGLEPLILSKIGILVKRFERAHHQGIPIKLDSAFGALTADIISKYGYGKSLEYLEDENFKNDIRDSLLAVLSLFHIVRFFPYIMIGAKVLPYRVIKLLSPQLGKVMGLRRLIRSISVEELDKMKQGVPSDATLLKALNDPSIPKSERKLQRLADEGFIFLNAGTTTGKTLAFTMFYLLNDDKVRYHKLRQELKDAFPDPNVMDHVAWKDLEALPYLRGCIYEGLRLVLGPLTRLPRVAPNEPLVYNDWVIPPGCGISESNYFVHMNPELFPNPTEFRPERWIEAQEKGERLQNYIVTFSKGTRHCLGMNLAYAESFMVVAILVRRFSMELYETTEKDVEQARDRLFGFPKGKTNGVRVMPSMAKD